MLYIMTNRINITMIILLTIKIISLKSKESLTNHRFHGNVEIYRHFTAIEFLKELEHSQPRYNTIVIMQNRNATISSIFNSHFIKTLAGNQNNGTAATNSKDGLSVLSEMATTTSFANSLMDRLQVPVLQLNELQSFYLKRHYGEHLISIVYIDINSEAIQMTLNNHKGLLEKLSGNLLHMRTSRVMFLLNFSFALKASNNEASATAAKINEDVIHDVLVQLFRQCWQQKIINVVALLADYQTTRKFYSYTHLPEFELEMKSIAFKATEQEIIYPNRLNNLKGYKLPIVVAGTYPRIILYTLPDGRQILGGFVGHFLRMFAAKFNCVLVELLPYRAENPLPSNYAKNFVRNASVEISAGLIWPQKDFLGATYPIELISWCVMVPAGANIPAYKFFTLVFKIETYLLVIALIVILSLILSTALHLHGYQADIFEIFCHDNCLRGILGQSFKEIVTPPNIVRFIYLKICILGMLVTTWYLSAFSTYLAQPPKEAALNSFDEILESDLKIIAWEYNYNLFKRFVEFRKYLPIFQIIKEYREFLILRDSLNTTYGYPVSDSKWSIINEQQKHFHAPLFKKSKDLCIATTLPVCFAVQENTIFDSMINRLILETSETGLLSKWFSLEFYEMIVAKQAALRTVGKEREFRAMSFEDLRYVMIFLGGMFLLVNLVFLGEIVVFNWHKIFNSLENYFCRNKRVRNKMQVIYNTK